MRSDLHHFLDHITDLAGITALTYLAQSPEPVSDGIIGAITTIAIGQRYAKAKWGNAYSPDKK
jgi:hypothetical protein